LQVKVKAHQFFNKEGLNVISEVPISITEAILGCKLTVETLDGNLNIDLKPGVNTGQEFILKHHGMPPF